MFSRTLLSGHLSLFSFICLYCCAGCATLKLEKYIICTCNMIPRTVLSGHLSRFSFICLYCCAGCATPKLEKYMLCTCNVFSRTLLSDNCIVFVLYVCIVVQAALHRN